MDPNQDPNNFSEDIKLPESQPRPPCVSRNAYLLWVEENRSNVLELAEFAAADNANLAEKKAVSQTTTAILIGLRRAWVPAKQKVSELLAKLPNSKWPAKWKPGKDLPLEARHRFEDHSIPQGLINLGKNTGYTLMQLVRARVTAHVEDFHLRKDIVVSTASNLWIVVRLWMVVRLWVCALFTVFNGLPALELRFAHPNY